MPGGVPQSGCQAHMLPQVPNPSVRQFAQAQMGLMIQGQLLQMMAVWLLIEQLTSGGGPRRCRSRGQLSGRGGRGWGRWRSVPSWGQGGTTRTPSHRGPTTRRRSGPPASFSIDRPVPGPVLAPGQYDGRTPAPETTSTRASALVHPPLTNSAPEGRDPNTYAQVINQFAVGDNPRYARRNGNTYCNIYAWDVTRAMGAELPHWRRHDGTPAQPFEQGAYEMNANGTARWLNQHGERYGWRQVSAEEAQAHANRGAPAVAIRENPGGIGHVAVVRPGEMTDRGPCIAQAGGRNFNEGNVRDVWRRSAPQYWVHD